MHFRVYGWLCASPGGPRAGGVAADRPSLAPPEAVSPHANAIMAPSCCPCHTEKQKKCITGSSVRGGQAGGPSARSIHDYDVVQDHIPGRDRRRCGDRGIAAAGVACLGPSIVRPPTGGPGKRGKPLRRTDSRAGRAGPRRARTGGCRCTVPRQRVVGPVLRGALACNEVGPVTEEVIRQQLGNNRRRRGLPHAGGPLRFSLLSLDKPWCQGGESNSGHCDFQFYHYVCVAVHGCPYAVVYLKESCDQTR